MKSQFIDKLYIVWGMITKCPSQHFFFIFRWCLVSSSRVECLYRDQRGPGAVDQHQQEHRGPKQTLSISNIRGCFTYLSYSCFNREENRKNNSLKVEEVLKIYLQIILELITWDYNIFRVCQTPHLHPASIQPPLWHWLQEHCCHHSLLGTGLGSWMGSRLLYWQIQILPLKLWLQTSPCWRWECRGLTNSPLSCHLC